MYLLHPPGGVAGGDDLEVSVSAAPGAEAVVTTPAAGKLYRHGDRWSDQLVQCRVAAGARLEWLPQETIAFAGTHARTTLRADVDVDGGLIAWDIAVLGRAAAGESFTAGAVVQSLAIERAGRPLLLERARFCGGATSGAVRDAWGLAGNAVHGTMVAVAPRDAGDLDLGALRACGDSAPGNVGISMVEPGVLVARFVGASGERARDYFEALRRHVRPAWFGRNAVSPRIWAT